MTKKICATCSAFNAMSQECRRKAPQAFVVVENGRPTVLGQWPATRETMWCLEHVLDIQVGEAGSA